MTMRKEGDRLYIDNHGTDRSTGSFNLTSGMFRACVTSPLLLFLAYDQYLCGGGVLAQLDFDFAEDAINSAHHPAAISTSLGLAMTLVQAQYLAAKVLSAAQRPAVMLSRRQAYIRLHRTWSMAPINLIGPSRFFPGMARPGAIGAFSFRDGYDHGGNLFAPIGPLGSVEGYERETPFLYLYRREVSDSGGHGQWRGGVTLVSAWTGHKSDSVFISSAGLLSSVTGGVGLLGGSVHGRTDVACDGQRLMRLWLLATSGLPPGPPRVAPWGGPPPPKKFDNRLLPGDLFEVMPQPGAGYGDPILRDPALVAQDVRLQMLDARCGRIYGVVTDDEALPTFANSDPASDSA